MTSDRDAAKNSALALDEQIDVDFVNELARFESYNKHHYRPNTYLHKWWARRCGSTFRYLLKQLVSDDRKRDYYAPGGLEGKTILDPMMGGGTTLHEAIRLGANVIGVDIDPIPVLQARASLSKPALDTLKDAFADIFGKLTAELGQFYSTSCPHCSVKAPMRFMLYGLRRWCECGEAIFVDSLTIRRNKDGSSLQICRDCHAVTADDVPCNCNDRDSKSPIITKGVSTCQVCLTPYANDLSTPYYARYAPLVVVSNCPRHGEFFAAPVEADVVLLETANRLRPGYSFGSTLSVEIGPKSKDLLRHGVDNYGDLFSSRQLLYLKKVIGLVRGLDSLDRLYISLLVSTSLDFNSMLCGYKGATKRRSGAIRHTFSHHAYSFPYTALENNPIYPRAASGTLKQLFRDRVLRARLWAIEPTERVIENGLPRKVLIAGETDFGEETSRPAELRTGKRRFLLRQGSATSLDLSDDSVDFVVTDPPYFDSVQYGDLARFFSVWLSRMLPEEMYSDLKWNYDSEKSAVISRTSGRVSDQRYVRTLGSIFAECHRVLRKEQGRLIFSFHHWDPDGWAAMTLALQQASFILVNRYVVHSENPTSVHISNLRALTDDAILVLAPKSAGIVKEWQRPASINTTKSAQFCYDCASLLGWMLVADWPDERIYRTWRKMLAR